MKEIKSKEDIVKLCNANDVQFLRLQFCDMHGLVKNMSVPIGQLDKVLDNKVMLDGSSIRGFRTIETSDMYFFPDVSAKVASQHKIRTQICFPVLDFPTAWAQNADEYIHKGVELFNQYRIALLRKS